MAEHFFYKFFMRVYGIEESLYAHFALGALCVRVNLYETARKLLTE
jgi:hypothetical protein